MDRHELLDSIRAGRGRLDSLLAGLPEARMADVVNGNWTRKDVLAHLEAWERRALEVYRLLAAGHDPNGIDDADTDAVNARFHAESRDRELDEIRWSEAAAYRAVLELAETAPDADLFDPLRFRWTEGDPFHEWITGNTNEHYDEHIHQLGAGLVAVGPGAGALPPR